MRRKVTIVRNSITGKMVVYSNKKKVFEKYQEEIGTSYSIFCRDIKEKKNGLTIMIKDAFGIRDKAVINEYAIF